MESAAPAALQHWVCLRPRHLHSSAQTARLWRYSGCLRMSVCCCTEQSHFCAVCCCPWQELRPHASGSYHLETGFQQHLLVGLWDLLLLHFIQRNQLPVPFIDSEYFTLPVLLWRFSSGTPVFSQQSSAAKCLSLQLSERHILSKMNVLT